MAPIPNLLHASSRSSVMLQDSSPQTCRKTETWMESRSRRFGEQLEVERGELSAAASCTPFALFHTSSTSMAVSCCACWPQKPSLEFDIP